MLVGELNRKGPGGRPGLSSFNVSKNGWHEPKH